MKNNETSKERLKESTWISVSRKKAVVIDHHQQGVGDAGGTAGGAGGGAGLCWCCWCRA